MKKWLSSHFAREGKKKRTKEQRRNQGDPRGPEGRIKMSGLWVFIFFSIMKLLVWNIRGIGGRGKDAALRKVTGEKKPSFLVLVETKHSQVNKRKIGSWWSGKWSHVSVVEDSGGLILDVQWW